MTDSLLSPVVLGAIAGTGILMFLFGWLGGRSRSAASTQKDDSTEQVEIGFGEEVEDPTAPITPMVEMAQSPHDRHRDLSIGKALVRRIDFLDSMIRNAVKKGDKELEGQLTLLRKEFFAILADCSVEAFEYPAGTVVDTAMRSRIQIVGGSVEGERTVIAETTLCGFLYLHGDEDTMILRKAEVVIG